MAAKFLYWLSIFFFLSAEGLCSKNITSSSQSFPTNGTKSFGFKSGGLPSHADGRYEEHMIKSKSSSTTVPHTALSIPRTISRGTLSSTTERQSKNEDFSRGQLAIIVCSTFVALAISAVFIGFFLNRRRTRRDFDASSSRTTTPIVSIIHRNEMCIKTLNSTQSTGTLSTSCPEEEWDERDSWEKANDTVNQEHLSRHERNLSNGPRLA